MYNIPALTHTPTLHPLPALLFLLPPPPREHKCECAVFSSLVIHKISKQLANASIPILLGQAQASPTQLSCTVEFLIWYMYHTSYIVHPVHAYRHYAHDLIGNTCTLIVGFYSCCAACSQQEYFPEELWNHCRTRKTGYFAHKSERGSQHAAETQGH